MTSPNVENDPLTASSWPADASDSVLDPHTTEIPLVEESDQMRRAVPKPPDESTTTADQPPAEAPEQPRQPGSVERRKFLKTVGAAAALSTGAPWAPKYCHCSGRTRPALTCPPD